MKKALTLLIFCFALLPLTAQNNWSSATLVKTEGDTLRGLIDFQNWRKNPSRIQFRSTSQATQESFGPLDLQSFWVPEESVHFQGAVVEVDFSPFATQQLTVDQQADFRLDTVFLRSVFLGAVNLYFLRDRDTKEHFFLQRPGGAIEELQYLRYLEEVGGKKVVKTKDIYKTQLLEYLGDCPAARNLIAGVRYREQDLLEILLAYQNCQAGAEPEFVGKTDLGRFIFGVAAAGILSKYDFVASSAPTLDEVEFELELNGKKKTFYVSNRTRIQPDVDVTRELDYGANGQPTMMMMMISMWSIHWYSKLSKYDKLCFVSK